ncbi:hypothetical protein GCM10009768_14960 [Leucobacter iarius]|uniref:DksA C4-type domain-containing protein n=1 Tax=Leucobacter iarius TaxID=333963 RepID=A0ABN2LG21_9MICO
MSRRQVRCIQDRCTEIARPGYVLVALLEARREGALPHITPKAVPVQAPPSPSLGEARHRPQQPCDRCGIDIPEGARILQLCRDCLSVVRGSERLAWAAA